MKKYTTVLLLIFLFSCKKENNTTNPIDYSNRSVGASAHDMLSADKYNTIVVEIQYMPGYEADATAISNVLNYLYSICNKNSITTTPKIIGANTHTLTLDSIKTIEQQNRTIYTNTDANQLGLYILITDGAYSEPDVLGIAYKNTSICLFGKTIFQHSGAIGQVTRVALESTVLEHETGHLLGLVNISSSMQTPHEDTAHKNHCNNKNCLMYYATVTNAMLGMMSTIPQLDANCKNDLKGNGGK